MRRRSAWLVVAPVVLLAAPAQAAEPGLGFFSLQAASPAVQVRVAEPSTCFATPAETNGCEGVLPEAISTLRNGPLGHGLAAVVWPGIIASGAGSLLITAGGANVPPQAAQLNDPVKAEAYNNTGDHVVDYTQVPGSTMTATAYDDRSSAVGSVGMTTVSAVGSFGRSYGSSTTTLVNPHLARATSHSEAKDVVIAGVVKVGAVVSDAVATTDGTAAKVVGSTTISGLSVSGVPVVLNGDGVTVAGNNLASSAAQDTVNSALAAAHITMTVGTASGRPQGASVTYNTGSLVIVQEPMPGYVVTTVLGGANVSVIAAKGLAFPVVTSPTSEPTTAPVIPAPVPGSVAVPGSTTIVPGQSGQPAPLVPSTPGQALQQALNQALSEDVSIPKGTPWLVGIIAALAVVGLAGAFKRLPDRILEHHPEWCALEDSVD